MYRNVLSRMKAKASLAGVFCSIGRFYFFSLDYFCSFVLLLTKRQRVWGMNPSLCIGRGEVPAPGSLWTPGLALQGRRESLPRHLFNSCGRGRSEK